MAGEEGLQPFELRLCGARRWCESYRKHPSLYIKANPYKVHNLDTKFIFRDKRRQPEALLCRCYLWADSLAQWICCFSNIMEE